VQPWTRVSAGAGARPGLTLRPDLTLDRAGRTLLILDVKWKRLSPTALPTDDVYQVLAYCAALGARRAVLVYPGRRNRTWHYILERSAIELRVATLRVAGLTSLCRAATWRFAAAVARQATDVPFD
jgi:5-methylcytosine-specific restriction enzyme subunit McrC